MNSLDFADIVAAGRSLVKSQDDTKWKLGDLVVVAFAGNIIAPGRPTADSDEPTLSDLAREWDTELPRVSEWHSVAAFYPSPVRTFNTLTWSHYNAARRAADGELDNALELLEDAVRLHLGINAFKRWLAGEIFEGYVPRAELSPRLQGMLGRGDQGAWMILKREIKDTKG